MTLITQAEIGAAIGLKRGPAIAAALRKAGIPFRLVGGKILTTEEAVTTALMGKGKKGGPNFAGLTPAGSRPQRGVLLRQAAGEEAAVDLSKQDQ